jgi:type IV secretion system protein VirB10
MTNEAHEVTDQRRAGRLAIPKNAQTYVLIGVAVLVFAVTIFGHTTPKQEQHTAPASTAGPRTDDLAAHLAKVQAEQQRLQAAIPNPVDSAAAPTSPAPMALSAEDRALLDHISRPSGSAGGGGVAPDDPLAEAKRKQRYASLFASNVALSYRPKPLAQLASGGVPGPQPDGSRLAASGDPDVAQLAALLRASDTTQPATALLPAAPTAATPAPTASNALNHTTPLAQQHQVFEGTVLEAVLLNRLNADFAGPIICHVSTPLLSRSRRHLLIPAGSRVIGQVQRVAAFGQERVAVAFHRLIMPDGYTLNLDRFTGLNAQGETALKDQVNHHYMRMFGGSIALGAISGLAALGTNYGGLDGVPATDRLRQGAAGGVAQSAQAMLQPFLNSMPTLTIREGHRVRVYFTQDLTLPAYAEHAMDPDL